MHIFSPAGGSIYLLFANLAKFRHYFEHCWEGGSRLHLVNCIIWVYRITAVMLLPGVFGFSTGLRRLGYSLTILCNIVTSVDPSTVRSLIQHLAAKVRQGCAPVHARLLGLSFVRICV
jgi:hypothetical protein